MIQEQDLGQDNVDWIRKITRPEPKDAPEIEIKSAKRGEKKGHPFRGNRYTGGIVRDKKTGAM